MTTATNLSPSKTALVRASSAYAPGWEWYFFTEESDGIFNGFVKSPFCPEGEYGLILSKDLIHIPWIHIGMNAKNEGIMFTIENYLNSMNLTFKISEAIRKD